MPFFCVCETVWLIVDQFGKMKVNFTRILNLIFLVGSFLVLYIREALLRCSSESDLALGSLCCSSGRVTCARAVHLCIDVLCNRRSMQDIQVTYFHCGCLYTRASIVRSRLISLREEKLNFMASFCCRCAEIQF